MHIKIASACQVFETDYGARYIFHQCNSGCTPLSFSHHDGHAEAKWRDFLAPHQCTVHAIFHDTRSRTIRICTGVEKRNCLVARSSALEKHEGTGFFGASNSYRSNQSCKTVIFPSASNPLCTSAFLKQSADNRFSMKIMIVFRYYDLQDSATRFKKSEIAISNDRKSQDNSRR